uniref:Bactericidal permeability-increasing protein n=1 Tax=Calidris pygmaea TaxID=425635 RepID=A0A8C3J961_9CHAR
MGAQSLAVACGALALCLTLARATNPGILVRITEAGLDYAHLQGMAILEKELTHVKLPDFSGDFRIRHVGKVHYELSGLDLQNFHLPYSRISLVPNVGLQVSISNAFADVNGNWRVKIHFLRDHGSFDITVENVYIKVNLKLGNNTSGKPTIDTSYCSTRISKVRVRFSGKLGWLYNLFHSAIESKFRKILESKICDIVAKSVRSDLQPYVQTLPGTRGALLGVLRAGECYSLAQRSAVPFSPLALTLPPDHDRMVYFGVSSYFFNTASVAYHEAGALVFEITDSMIPKTIDFHLKTTTFSAFVPQVSGLYPDMQMKLRLSAPSAPFLNIGPGGLSLRPVVDIQAYAILPNASMAPLFLLSLVSLGTACSNDSGISSACPWSGAGKERVGRRRWPRALHSPCSLLVPLVLIPMWPRVLSFPDRLGQGFPLPLLDRIQLSDILVQFHQVSVGSPQPWPEPILFPPEPSAREAACLLLLAPC